MPDQGHYGHGKVSWPARLFRMPSATAAAALSLLRCRIFLPSKVWAWAYLSSECLDRRHHSLHNAINLSVDSIEPGGKNILLSLISDIATFLHNYSNTLQNPIFWFWQHNTHTTQVVPSKQRERCQSASHFSHFRSRSLPCGNWNSTERQTWMNTMWLAKWTSWWLWFEIMMTQNC